MSNATASLKTWLMTAQVNAADDRVTHEITASDIHAACGKMRERIMMSHRVCIITHWVEIA